MSLCNNNWGIIITFGVTQSDERSHHLIDQTDLTIFANGCVGKSLWGCCCLSQKTSKAVLWRPLTDLLLTHAIVKSCRCPLASQPERLWVTLALTVLCIFVFPCGTMYILRQCFSTIWNLRPGSCCLPQTLSPIVKGCFAWAVGAAIVYRLSCYYCRNFLLCQRLVPFSWQNFLFDFFAQPFALSLSVSGTVLTPCWLDFSTFNTDSFRNTVLTTCIGSFICLSLTPMLTLLCCPFCHYLHLWELLRPEKY